MLTNRLFLMVHAVLLCVVVAAGAYRAQALTATRALPTLRDEPLTVEPTYDYNVVITDEQLDRVLTKLRPRFESEKTKINHVDHALRFWTLGADFGDDPAYFSGYGMRRLLLNHGEFAKVYGEDEPPLLLDDRPGVSVRTQQGNRTSSHVDHTMACLAEVGTPLDHPVVLPTRETTFRELVEQSLREFSINQIEYEWSALTYALFLPPERSWTTTEGQQMTFDLVAQRIMRERLPRGVCFGNHRLHTLVMFLRIDDQISILEPATREEIMEFLANATQLLVQHQHPDGFWNDGWPLQTPESPTPTEREGDRIAERILATGHALEWWSLAPEELHPPRHVLAAAGQWLVRTIDELSEQETLDYYTYLTHAGRALSLWRSRNPAQVVTAETLAAAAEQSATPAAVESPAAESDASLAPSANNPPSER